eukprot:gene13838-biopygen10428
MAGLTIAASRHSSQRPARGLPPVDFACDVAGLVVHSVPLVALHPAGPGRDYQRPGDIARMKNPVAFILDWDPRMVHCGSWIVDHDPPTPLRLLNHDSPTPLHRELATHSAQQASGDAASACATSPPLKSVRLCKGTHHHAEESR